VLRVIPMPADVNANGDIFGGWVMAQVDLAGSVLPARHMGGRFATVAVNQFLFKQPVKVGDLLSFYGSIVRIGNTSITVEVEVWAERNANLRRHRRKRSTAPGAASRHRGLTPVTPFAQPFPTKKPPRWCTVAAKSIRTSLGPVLAAARHTGVHRTRHSPRRERPAGPGKAGPCCATDNPLWVVGVVGLGPL